MKPCAFKSVGRMHHADLQTVANTCLFEFSQLSCGRNPIQSVRKAFGNGSLRVGTVSRGSLCCRGCSLYIILCES